MTLFKNFKLAAWASIADVILTFPALALTIYTTFLLGVEDDTSLLFSMAEIAIYLVAMLTSIIIICNIKYLLREHLNTEKASTTLSLLLGVSVLAYALIILSIALGPSDISNMLDIAGMAIPLPQGILNIVLGIKILKLDSDLLGFRKSFGVFNIITGCLLMTILLAPLALVTAIVLSCIYAMMFFRASKELSPSR